MSELLPPLLLAVLAIVDAGFSGYRSVQGANPRIRKEAYHRRAIRRGLQVGVLACVGTAALLAALFLGSPSAAAWNDLLERATVLIWSFGTYATLVLLGIGLWFVAEADLRTLASVVILGPFTLIRPLWILATCLGAAVGATTWLGAVAPLLAAGTQLAIEPWLARELRPEGTR
jgi:hypothetical protein